MKNLFKVFSLIFVLLLSACSPYRESPNQFSVKQLELTQPHYAQVQNGKIEYYRFGKGSPVVLIAGYATDVTSWDARFLASLANHHQVIVFNNRNVGGSVVNSESYTSKDLANDTAQLITDLKLKKPTIVGISMGGMIAQQFAVLYPQQLSKLVLINTAIAGKQAVHPSAAIEKQMKHMPKHDVARLVSGLQLFFPRDSWLPMTYSLISDRFMPLHYHEKDTTRIMPKQMDLVMRWVSDNATAKKIAKLQVKTLILNGEADVVIPPINSVILARTIPQAQLLRWKDGGHGMIFQYPTATAKAINDFVS